MQKEKKSNDSAAKKTLALYKAGLEAFIYSRIRWLSCPFKIIEEVVPNNCKILDVGAGYGVFSIYMATADESREVMGLDINKKVIKFANYISKDLKNVSFFSQDVTKTEELAKTDVVIMNDILHHINFEEQKALISRIFSNLGENGLLIIKEIDTKPKWKYYWNYIYDFLTMRKRIYCRSEKEWKSLFEKAGFGIETKKLDSILPYSHVLFVCEK